MLQQRVTPKTETVSSDDTSLNCLYNCYNHDTVCGSSEKAWAIITGLNEIVSSRKHILSPGTWQMAVLGHYLSGTGISEIVTKAKNTKYSAHL